MKMEVIVGGGGGGGGRGNGFEREYFQKHS